MKTTILLLLACTGICAGAGVPDLGPAQDPGADRVAHGAVGVVIESGVQSSQVCRLIVRSDDHTVVDRGVVDRIDGTQEVEGSFRFWTEDCGRVLYVYDEVQNLICRVCNPESVTLVDLAE